MAQQAKILAAKPDDLSTIPRTHMVDGETQLPQLSSTLCTCAMAHTAHVGPSTNKSIDVKESQGKIQNKVG